MRGQGPVDWPSILVVLFFPAMLTVLVVEQRSNTRGHPSRERRGS
jgi:hypothetical protein